MRSMLLSAVAAASLSLAAGSALAADLPPEEPIVDTVWYLGVFGGASWADLDNGVPDNHDDFNLDTEIGWTAGGVLGINFVEHVRGEIEVSYAQYNLDDCDGPGCGSPGDHGDIAALYALANLWWDLDFGGGGLFGGGGAPYIGGGAGAAMLDLDFAQNNDNEWAFAFQAGAGFRFGLGGPVTVDVGYRFKGIPDVGFNNGLDAELYSHNAQIGLNFEF